MGERDDRDVEPALRAVRRGTLSGLIHEMFAAEASAPGVRWAREPGPGAVIGRFELGREVGRGGFAIVYEARDRELGRSVAFKLLVPGQPTDVAEDRLLREAEAAARLCHPNIVTIYDVGRSEWGPYLVLELLRGGTLERRLRSAALSAGEALSIALEVAKGLAHAHAHGVVHRDLTTRNVFLCDDGAVKLLDLGMAHAFGRRKLEGGTPAYMAPEQWIGAPEDERTDVFALGVLLYRMITDELPFPDDAGRSLMASRPAPFVEVAETPGLGEIVSRMLEKDPVRRPRDAGEVLRALRALEQEQERLGSRSDTLRIAPSPPTPPDRPSIAVLPFTNMSSDPEQDYFADGMAEDIITALSRFRQFFVIARNSSFTYKGRAVDIKQVGRELGVRYVLEGSVRKAATGVRITGQLIDASTGAHLWADHYDGALEDVFRLQDRVTASVVGVIAPTLERVAIERAARKRTERLDAYDHYLRGMASLYPWTREATSEALRHFHRALDLDPGFSSAYGMAAWCYVWRKGNRWMVDRAGECAEAARLAWQAVRSGADDAVALTGGGYALVFVGHDLDGGSAYIDRALALNPNLAWALTCSGWTRAFLGRPDDAIQQLVRARRLSPLDPLSFRTLGGIAFAHLLAGRYDDATTFAESALRERDNYLPALRDLAAAHALAGRDREARNAVAHLLEIEPELRVTSVQDWIPLRRSQDLATLRDGLRRAGLPE